MDGSTRGNTTVTSAISSLVDQRSTSTSTKMEVDSKTKESGQARHGANVDDDLPGLVKSATDGSVSDESAELDTVKINSSGAENDHGKTNSADCCGEIKPDDVAVEASGHTTKRNDSHGAEGLGEGTAEREGVATSGFIPKEDDSPGAEEAGDSTVTRESLRESLRARLRAQEARLKGLVRNASSDGVESVIGQMKTKMHQVAAEKSALEMELERLRGAAGDDEFLKDKLADIQEGFDKQVRLIQSLQRQLDERHESEEKLRSLMLARLSRLVELEFDLSTHELREYYELSTCYRPIRVAPGFIT